MSRSTNKHTRRASSRPKATIWLISLLTVITVTLVIAVVVRGQQQDPVALPAIITSPTPSPAPPSVRPTPKQASLKEARAALRTAKTVSVIGDSTGNNVGEWVTLWAGHLGRKHQVEVHQWVAADQRYLDRPLPYGNGGKRLAIWNAAKPGGTTDWAAAALDVVQPERPDLVILNLGHNNTGENVGAQLETMRTLLTKRWDAAVPLVVILQNPGRGDHAARQAETLRAVRGWALNRGVPTIDVTSAFDDPDRLMRDDAHPNPAGSRVWADTVIDALG